LEYAGKRSVGHISGTLQSESFSKIIIGGGSFSDQRSKDAVLKLKKPVIFWMEGPMIFIGPS
jgi:hypothetical protein